MYLDSKVSFNLIESSIKVVQKEWHKECINLINTIIKQT